jgi:hypothetical protein
MMHFKSATIDTHCNQIKNITVLDGMLVDNIYVIMSVLDAITGQQK